MKIKLPVSVDELAAIDEARNHVYEAIAALRVLKLPDSRAAEATSSAEDSLVTAFGLLDSVRDAARVPRERLS